MFIRVLRKNDPDFLKTMSRHCKS